MMRKNIFIILFFSVLAVILPVSVSCVHSDMHGKQESATVYLEFKFNGSGLDVDTGEWTKSTASRNYVDASQYEGIRTLRVIVTSGQPGSRKILRNIKVENLGNLSEYQMAIQDLPSGELFFYVIGNEECLGKTYDDATILNDMDANHKILFVDDAESRHFPKQGPDIVTYGLPLSGSATATVTGDMSLDINLYRTVVKLCLTVENATNSDIVLNKVSFGPFSGDRFYMFRELELDVPEDTQYGTLVYDTQNILISSGTMTQKLSAYIYPTYPQFVQGNSPFTIQIETEAMAYPSLVFAPNTNSFTRNTQVNINARITTVTGIELTFTVEPWTTLPWEDYNQDVPTFE